MNLDKMKQGWRDHNHELADECFDELASEVKSRADRFERAIRRRDWIEAVAASLVFVALAFFLIFNRLPPVMTGGIVMIMFAVVEIIFVMFWTRHRDTRPQNGDSLLEFSEAEVTRINRQIVFLQRVTWWYCLPLFFSCFVFLFGVLLEITQFSRLTFFAYLMAFLLCFVWASNAIYRLNRKAVKLELIPARNRIAEFIESLKSSEKEGAAKLAKHDPT